ncbi:MAG TPA: hypothetical protein VD846_13215 [Allosphingosinicella sp.]|nr:hypothetical protein [Allosphingosinicella sp.]
MKRLILAAAGLLLATANTPPAYEGAKPEGELDSVVAAEAPGQAAPAAAKPANPKPHKMAAAPAEPRAGTYPRCSATVRDRCVQGRSGARHRSAPQDRRIQLAMRAGERG